MGRFAATQPTVEPRPATKPHLRYNAPESTEAAPIVTYVDEASPLIVVGQLANVVTMMRTGNVPYSSALGRDAGASTLTAFVPKAPRTQVQ